MMPPSRGCARRRIGHYRSEPVDVEASGPSRIRSCVSSVRPSNDRSRRHPCVDNANTRPTSLASDDRICSGPSIDEQGIGGDGSKARTRDGTTRICACRVKVSRPFGSMCAAHHTGGASSPRVLLGCPRPHSLRCRLRCDGRGKGSSIPR